jgi:aspartyl-tRNA(Asn)/glutamyl-tRNA(Gln) amidotransferase subunit A
MTGLEVGELTIADAAELIKRRDLSPVDVVSAALERIRLHDDRLRAFISVFEAQALEAARAAERMVAQGNLLGPLHGIPIAVKDNILTQGMKTTGGSRILADFVPAEDATSVLRLKQAGAIIVGKTNLHEFAWGGTTANPHFGATRNPWDTSRFPGGSSGGSAAAVAARECMGALGTDTDGSVRVPAAFTGVVGLRPTIGRVSNHGVVPLAWSMDTVGPICRTAEDCALILDAIAGYDEHDPNSAQPALTYPPPPVAGSGLRVGVDEEFCFGHVQPDIERAVRAAIQAFEGAGASIVPIRLEEASGHVAAELTVVASEASTYHQLWLRERAQDYGDDVRTQLELGSLYLATHYIQAQRYRTVVRQATATILQEVDLVLSPTVPFVAIPVGETRVAINTERQENAMTAVMQFSGLASLTGFPAVSVPCGFSNHGLPIGMQLLGRPFEESNLLNAAALYQSVTGWHRQSPPL